jgi:hypothetical protein
MSCLTETDVTLVTKSEELFMHPENFLFSSSREGVGVNFQLMPERHEERSQ